LDPDHTVADLGTRWDMNRMVFKKIPSCGATQGMTELTLQLVHSLHLDGSLIERVTIHLNPYCHRLVGAPFQRGENPRVDAQFSAQYCVANAIVRGSSKLPHFRAAETDDARVRRLIPRINCVADPALDARGHSAVDVFIQTISGSRHHGALDVSPGFPGNGLSEEDHVSRFNECLAYARYPLPDRQAEQLLKTLTDVGELPDARQLIDLLISPDLAAITRVTSKHREALNI
jgi:2-methylcitrate dehydratase PrpD